MPRCSRPGASHRPCRRSYFACALGAARRHGPAAISPRASVEILFRPSQITRHGVHDEATQFSGEMAERLKAHAWKACVPKGTVGSNPTLSATKSAVAENSW